MAALGMLGKLGDLAEATRHTLLAALPAAKAGRPGSRRGVAARAARRRSTAALGVVALAAGAIGVVATRSPGYPTQRVEPNDGAVWVTNDRVGLFGRLNGPARALDTALAPVDKTQNHQLDVLQAGATVVARDRVAGRLAPIDVRSGQLLKDRAIPSPPGAALSVGNGTVASLDPATGALRATWAPADAVASVDGLRPEDKPTASVGIAPGLGVEARGAAATVGADGVVHLVGSSGQVATLRPDSAPGRFAVTTAELGAALQDVQVALVGDRLVIVDVIGASVVLPGQTPTALSGAVRGAVIQQNGPAAAEVLLATSTELLSLDLASGKLITLYDRGTGSPAAPVVFDGCRYAAWAGSPGAVVRVCGDAPPEVLALEGATSIMAPQLRQNRRTVVVNEGLSGAVWELPSGKRLDNWESVAPPPVTATPEKKPEGPSIVEADKEPTAVADELAARPGRTSQLHLLDNDANPSGSVLSIRDVSDPRPSSATLSIAPDGQSVQITLAPGSGPVSFTYTIDDGKSHQSTAPVTVAIRQPTDNAPPQLRDRFTARVFPVASQGRLALPVIGDWRDPDSDPVVLASALDGTVVVPVSSDGRIHFAAPVEPGPHKIGYTVTDGDKTASAEIPVDVLAKGSSATSAATTEPDVSRGEVDKAVTIRPLDNDLPGTDPTTPSARLELAGEVVAPEGTTVTTDVKTGDVTLTAGAPGTYLLTYTAAYGMAPYARGTIRVDISQPRPRDTAPTAMLDQAVVYGQTPALIDVLANDVDPTGRLLAVQAAEPVDGASLEVAVVRGRWLRIRSTAPTLSPNPQRIRYTLTNGVSASVTGDVSVLQMPPPVDGNPTAVDDFATVRAGDSVVVPVLDNDADPTNQPLTLVTRVDGQARAGTLPVTTGTAGVATGNAYVSATLLRYQAPAITTAMTVAVTYVAEDPDGNRATGTAYVTVVPPPTPDRPDQAPTPPVLEGRVVAGDTMTIQIPSSGADPDGDSVTLVGLGSVPAHGRVMAMSPSSITYQAYPTSAETDEFTYVVTDRYERVATGLIRIAVLPPGQPQPVVAVDDILTAAPGASVIVEPLRNDIVAVGDVARLAPLEPLNPELGGQASVDAEAGTMRVTAPQGLAPLSVRYAVRGASGEPSSATVTVRALPGFNIPPVARGAFANPEGTATTVTVDVLATAYDPDGGDRRLTVSNVFTVAGAKVDGGKVTVPVAGVPQIVPFEVTDADGAAALGVIYVPAVGSGGPHVKPFAQVNVDQDSSVGVTLADVVIDPAGKPVILTRSDRLFASPAGMVAIEAVSKDQIKVIALKGYVGPASVSFEVTDGTSTTDPAGKRALITVPVQVGPETPVLRCPPTEITVVQGGQSRPISIPELCHVWTARAATYDALQFVGRFPNQDLGLTVSNGDPRRLVVTAGGEAIPDSRAQLQVTVPGTKAVPAVMTVHVLPSAPPTMSPVSIVGVRAGTSATVNIAGYINSQLGAPDRAIVSVARSGAEARVETNGKTTLTVTPDLQAKGRIVLTVTVTDIAETSRRDRHGVGTVTVDVLGLPDAPGAPVSVGGTASHEATLTWAVPANNGLPIDYYTLTWSGGTQRCTATPCRVTGLLNTTAYVFTVAAHNPVGDGPPSQPSAPVRPDQVPPAPTSLRTSDPQDHSLVVSWEPPKVDGSPATKYLVSWPGDSMESTGTSVTANGLDNSVVTTFQVKAMNDAGWGPAATVTGQSAGLPPRPEAPTLTPVEILDGARQTVNVSWSSVVPNGPGDTTYVVTRTGPDGAKDICTTTTTSCEAPDVVNDGSTYTFTVVARNDVFSSPPSPSTPLIAVGRPGSFSGLDAQATGVSRQVSLSFTSPAAHDKQVTITCMVGGTECGTWTAPEQPTRFDQLVSVPENGSPAQITLTARNSSPIPSEAVVTSDIVYGPVGQIRIVNPRPEGPYAAFSVAVDPQGLPVTVTVKVSVGGRTMANVTEDTTGGPFTVTHSVKVGFGQSVAIWVEATRRIKGTSDTTTDTATTTTGQGTVTLTGTPASTCVAGQPCTDVQVSIAVRNMAFTKRVGCTISLRNQDWGPFSLTTSSTGGGSVDVPEADFLAITGTAYDVTCDDSSAPSAPVTTTWTAP